MSSASPASVLDNANDLEITSILLLDDDVELADTLKIILESRNFVVTTARNGVEGLREVMEMDFDVIICDLMMPTMPGDMFYLAVNKVKPKLCRRFLFVTGHGNEPRIRDFLNTTEQGMKMIADVGSPALKLLLDTFHMNIEEKDVPAAIRRAGKHIAHIHACGSDRGTPGNDHLDWLGIAKALRDIRYDGDVVVESFTPDVKVIARAAAIWRHIEPTREEIAVNGLKFLKRNLK